MREKRNSLLELVVPVEESPVEESVPEKMYNRVDHQEATEGESIDHKILRASIERLACHVPHCVLATVANEVKNRGSGAVNDMPIHSQHQAALLQVDISGFTRLSTTLEVEDLSKEINAYFNMILNDCASYGGDVLLFAGDAIFVEWPVREGLNCRTLQDAVTFAALCGSSIVKKCSDRQVAAGSVDLSDDPTPLTLNVHCGLAAGTIGAVHVGDDKRRQLLLVGEIVDQVGEAERHASHGEVACSPKAMPLLAQTSNISVCMQDANAPKVIATRDTQLFSPVNESSFTNEMVMSSFQRTLSGSSLSTIEEDAHKKATEENFMKKIIEGLSSSELSAIFNKLCLYVHRVARMASIEFESVHERGDSEDNLLPVQINKVTRRNSMGPTSAVPSDVGADTHGSWSRRSISRVKKNPRRRTAGEVENRPKPKLGGSIRNMDVSSKRRHISDAELRSVYVMFISPLVDAVLSGDREKDLKLFKLLNDIMIVTGKILGRFGGDLIQFCRDDKGLVLVAAFGLRGSTYPNMVSERGLPAAIAIKETLKDQLNVDSRMGATIGKVYCGVVGGIYRHGFSVLGPSVNLAARLSASRQNPGFLVNGKVQLQASKRFDFRPLPPVQAKGYRDLVPICEPTSALDRGWKEAKIFVGRSYEIEEMRRVADIVLMAPPEEPEMQKARMILVHAESGLGKSSTVLQAIKDIRRLCSQNSRQVDVVKSVCDENEELAPFSAFRSIFRSALSSSDATQGVRSKTRGAAMLPGIKDDDLSIDDDTIIKSKLFSLCTSMGKSTEFAEIVAKRVLGIETQGKTKSEANVNPKDLAEFVTDAFLRCTAQNALEVVAVDDVQWMDWSTWEVLKLLFDRAKNLIIIAISRPLSDYTLHIEPAFWNFLQQEASSANGRYIELHMRALEKSDMRQLIADNFGTKKEYVDAQVADDMFNQSGGMPAFAVELMENVKRHKMLHHDDNGILVWSKDKSVEAHRKSSHVFSSVGQLLLHRFDSMGPDVRHEVQVCAMLGLEFTLNELQMVSEVDYDALQQAVDEDILIEVVAGVDFYEENVSVSYRFRHALWRSCVLSTMLGEQKSGLHYTIARAYETEHRFAEGDNRDTRLMLKVFSHWKGAKQPRQASELALLLGDFFTKFGLHRQSLAVYKDALGMWSAGPTQKPDCGETSKLGGVSMEVLQKTSATDLDALVRLKIAMGKCYANLLEGVESAHSFQHAYNILVNSPDSAKDLKDRSIVFPIFSGLCLALKWGNIKDDDECTYEQELVQRFVDETVLHADPVHIARALAMQANLLARIGKLEEALEVQRQLECIYNADEHSAGICKSYGSDRAAQSFGLATQWYEQLGQHEMADAQIETCLRELMPKMEARNVHNSFMIIYPFLWILKDRCMASRANEIFQSHVVDQFITHFGKDSTTFFLITYEPMTMLLGLAGDTFDDAPQDKFTEMEDWILEKKPGFFKAVMETALGQIGRDCSSIMAEICLLLASRSDPGERRAQLVDKGNEWLRVSVERSQGGTGCEYAFLRKQLRPISDAFKKGV